MVFRGVTSTAMIYDIKPIFDHFRRVNEDLVMGAMDCPKLYGTESMSEIATEIGEFSHYPTPSHLPSPTSSPHHTDSASYSTKSMSALTYQTLHSSVLLDFPLLPACRGAAAASKQPEPST
ncbi:MAG: hypothetical protein LQ348_006118 [Seirophora lacunosa]|nr:MAG: hypothetical protein LQ348_006118 [Seirophora lacunosa]